MRTVDLKSIVEDVGADKGVMVTEYGFQPGAYSAATSTNILLTTLDALRHQMKYELQETLLKDLEHQVLSLS